jgi:RNA polymerase sigma-70 factor (ECF subfamily)
MVTSRAHLLAAFDAGRATRPDVGLAFDEFASRMEKMEVAVDDLAVRGADLLLAVACAAADPGALRCFEAEFLSDIARRVARFNLSPDKVDELRQMIRVKLLVGQSPGIGRYQGRAPLGAWLHVAAVRLAMDIATSVPVPETDIDLLEMVSLEGNPEAETAKNLYRDRFKGVLEASFQALPTREKTILRLHVVDGLTIDAIGMIYAVHRATAARWLVAIRKQILETLKRELGLHWKASSSEFRSLAWLLREQVHVTAERVLRSDP